MVYLEVVQQLINIRNCISTAAQPLDGRFQDVPFEPVEDESFDHQILRALAKVREYAIEAEILALKLSTECAQMERHKVTGLAPDTPSDPD